MGTLTDSRQRSVIERVKRVLWQAPVETTLVVVAPLGLAASQLLIALVGGGSRLAMIAFAIVMVAFAWTALGYLEAGCRRRRLIDGG